MLGRTHRPAMLGAVLSLASAHAAPAQTVTPYDPAQLPVFYGKVAQYDLDRHGGVDGLILDDGTEVHVAAHLATQLVAIVKPGDAVTVHGIRARKIDLVQAMSVSNDASKAGIIDSGIDSEAGSFDGSRVANGEPAEVQGTIRLQLHDVRGNLDGVLLSDRTIVHLPPRAGSRVAPDLTPGHILFARGTGRTNGLGRVIDAREAGPSPGRTTPLQGGL